MLNSFFGFSQEAPKRELRAAWIATVANIDWPSKPGLPAIQQQQEFTARLDQLQILGCNAVIVQIRPAADALYPSEIEPWSRYLTGRQGQPPFPYYDPLEFMIAETHKRNMEFHAWFNPFRGLVDSRKNPNPADHITRQHPDWTVDYGHKTYLNPGIPEVRNYVTKVILDVAKRYDIDAVHLDDYFYPYRIANQEFGDQKSYTKYKGSFDNKDDWRRNNINLFISNLNLNLKHLKPYLKLGISPFGIWRNASKDPKGSNTKGGQTTYDDLYADVVLWMQKGWIDYLMPQLYWEHGHRAAAFEVLLPWWEKHKYKRHIYYGLGLYRMSQAKGKLPWSSPDELLSQIKDIRELQTQSGYSFYSASCFDKSGQAIKDSIRTVYQKFFALPPTMPWLDNTAPPPPHFIKIDNTERGMILRWATDQSTDVKHYAVYRFDADEKIEISNAKKIIAVQSETMFVDLDAPKFPNAKYVVTALDRLWNESAPSANTAEILK